MKHMKSIELNALVAVIATALAAPFSAPVAAQSEGDPLALEEVIVTAQKREQSFNDVGIAVSVFSEAAIKELRMFRPEDVAAQTPNVKINETLANSIVNVVIRGVGLNDYAANNNPAAGIYVDEVYLVSPAMLNFQLFDLQRIEVLKGPQGTLYGRNTNAGTVNFISNKPTEEFSAFANIEAGNYDYFGGEAAVGGQLTDGLTGRIALQTYQRGEGHQFNRLTGEDVGEIDRTSLRGMLNWEANENLNFLFNWHGGEDNSDVWLTKIDNPFTPEDDGDTDPYRSGASNASEMDMDAEGASLTIDWGISDTLSLISVTGYEHLERHHIEDRDASSLIMLDGDFMNDIEQFSQEVRLNYVNDDLVLIGGAFYGNDEVKTRDRFDASDLLPLLGLTGTDAIGNEYRQETDSYAVFGHSEYQFSEAWKLTAGLRYTNEDKKFSDAFTYIIAGGAEIPVHPTVNNSYDVDDFSGKIGIDYVGWDNTLVYASISKGFKSGGFQGQLTFNPDDLQPFDEETMWAYEVGAKMQMADNRVQLNSAVFYYDYEDLQFYGGLFDSPVGTLFGITNVGDADVYGAELELWWLAAEGLDFRLGVGWLDTEITRSEVAGVEEGSSLPNSPEWNFNALARYQFSLTDDLDADMLLDLSYQDDVAFDIIRAPAVALEDGYWLANARIGIGRADGRWNVYLWAKNLFDEEYRTQVLFSSVGYGESWSIPRTWGIGATFDW